MKENKLWAASIVGERFLEENGYLLMADLVIRDLIVQIVEANKNRVDPAVLSKTLTTVFKDRRRRSNPLLGATRARNLRPLTT